MSTYSLFFVNFSKKTIFVTLFVFTMINTVMSNDEFEILQRGKMSFRVTSIDYNLTIGVYSLTWDITPNEYRIDTHLVPRGLASLFVDYTLSEASTGIVQDQELQWKRYEMWHKYDDTTKNQYETAYQQPDQRSIKMNDAQVPITDEPIDIPSMIIALMRQPPLPNAQRAVEVFYPKSHHPITMKMMGTESVEVPAGRFSSWKWKGKTDQYNMSLWYDQKTRRPLKVIFTNNRGDRFLLEADSWAKKHQHLAE